MPKPARQRFRCGFSGVFPDKFLRNADASVRSVITAFHLERASSAATLAAGFPHGVFEPRWGHAPRFNKECMMNVNEESYTTDGNGLRETLLDWAIACGIALILGVQW